MTTPGGYSAGSIFLQVVPSFRNFQNAIRKEAKLANKAFEDEQRDARQRQASEDVRAAEKRGRESGGAYARAMNKAIDGFLKAVPKVELDIDASKAEKRMQDLRHAADEIAKMKINFDIDSRQARQAHAILAAIREEMKKLGMAEASPEVVVRNAAAAFAELKAVDAGLDSIDGRKARARVEVDTDGATRGLGQMIKQLANNQNALRGFNGRVLALAAALPMIGPAAAAAAGGIFALGAAASVALLGVGVLLGGFSGVGDATKALGDVQKNGAKDALAAAKTMRNAGRAVRDAEQGVASARQAAADSAADAARRVSDAVQAQQEAEEDLIDAQRDVLRAQERVNRAREEAAEQIFDLQLKLRGGALAERQAVIDLFEAEVSFRNIMGDGGATNLEREQASINRERAVLELEEIRATNARLAEEQAEVARTGVEGTQTVIQAQEGLATAQERVEDAQRAVGTAAQDVAQAQADSARSQRYSAIAIRDAQERLVDSQLAYQEALESTGEIGSGSMQKLNDAMSKLGPAGRAFSRFLHTDVLPALRETRGVIQEAMLPGIQGFLTALLPYMPQISAFLGAMATVVGDLAREFGVLITQSPAWEQFWGVLANLGPGLLRTMGEIGMLVLTIFAQVFTAFAPFLQQFLTWLSQVLTQFSAWLQTEEGQQAMAEFFGYIAEVAPLVGEALFALVGAAVQLAKALAPIGESLLTGLTEFLEWVANTDPDQLRAWAATILIAIVAIQTILGVMSLIATVGAAVEGAMAIARIAILGTMLSVVGILLVVGIAFALLWWKSETFRDIVTAAFEAVGTAVSWVWENILKPVFNAIWETLKWVWDYWSVIFELVGLAFAKAFDGIKEYWDRFANSSFGEAIIGFFQRIVDEVQEIWNGLTDIFKGVVRLVVTVVNEGLVDPINAFAKAAGAKGRIDRIPMPFDNSIDVTNTGQRSGKGSGLLGLATGGMVPGYSPTATADNIPAMLTAGEFVLPVNAVRRLRDQYGDQFLEMLRRGGMPGYAKGGLVEFGRLLQGRGFRVNEHPAFGGVRGRHARNSRHYSGNAIDVNYGPGGENDIEKRAIDAIVGLAKDYGLRTIWRTSGHFNHAHFDVGGGSNIMGKIGNAAWEAFKGSLPGGLGLFGGDIVDAGQYLLNKVLEHTGLNTLRESAVGRAMLGPVHKVVGWGRDWLQDTLGPIGDFVSGDDKELPAFSQGGPVKLYDSGGWLQPGLTTVLNASGRPEPVFSAQQWEQIAQGAMGGGDTINIPVTQQNDPAAVAEAVMFAKRVQSRGGVYAGRV